MISLDLANDELNNHECMATVCRLVQDLDRITLDMFSPEQSSKGDCSSEWVKLITDVLSDRTRHNNVRLFLAQVSLYFICDLPFNYYYQLYLFYYHYRL